MGRRGPAPAPTAIKIAAGNPGRHPLNHAEPVLPEANATGAPESLSDEAKQLWFSLFPMLSESKVLTAGDLGVLEVYCQAWADYREACRILKKPGKKVQKAQSGYTAITAWVTIKKEAAKEMRSSGAELGLTPASRSRVQTVKPKEQKNDGKARFFKPRLA